MTTAALFSQDAAVDNSALKKAEKVPAVSAEKKVENKKENQSASEFKTQNNPAEVLKEKAGSADVKQPDLINNKVSEKIPAKTVVPDKKSISEKNKDVPEKKQTAQIAPVKETVKNKIINKKKSGHFRNQDLLETDDSSIKYHRIPGYIIKSAEKAADAEIAVSGGKDRTEDVVDPKKGLFGLDKEATDFVSKGAIVLLFFFIAVIYRLRSRRSNRKVMRNYSKK